MNSVVKILLKLTALSGLLMFAPQALTAPAQTAQSGAAAEYQPALENERDPNQYCAKCHSLDTEADQAKGEFHAGRFHGIHLGKNNPATGKPINCVSCHGNISENHRRGVKDVMRFQGNIFSDEKPMYSVQEQNQVCFSCHKPQDLREKFWAHDVHAMKLPCASCHTLHPKKDAMAEIQPKQRVKLCVDCHGEQQKRKQAQSGQDMQPLTEAKDKK
ncbi:respiratory nitrite reductase-specific menaquinol--cytochrome-c reductase complex subunit NrfB precursor [Mesocricetibacter intestinalis]|uniref:Respiratory nitrite reductase-specific menaquinol--cytochrome-c reductase complex subunit NrfB n=1 Tax=Mesocricetibacter intestinalis TaxID=1521930 RepID=A0A4R6VBT4_9PAST|nr:cytochrome c nitrite reductase pentaheme subunit [Mesocricetibacter intestinalis]TDQ57866.1 respiratory nitrite reductase-specific menaquinol--cytochrome-c reductase complex subunit NrfB precursor [Mesocricetibacter intestinalis]